MEQEGIHGQSGQSGWTMQERKVRETLERVELWLDRVTKLEFIDFIEPIDGFEFDGELKIVDQSYSYVIEIASF